MKIAIMCCIICWLASSAVQAKPYFTISSNKFLADEDAINLYCLRLAYPDVDGITSHGNKKFLRFKNGSQILYDSGERDSGLDADLRRAMAAAYPLEPARPCGDMSPGRERSYNFLKKIYGETAQEVARQLATVNFMGKKMRISSPAASPLQKAAIALEQYAKTPEQKAWLKPDGTFYWRKIAGENVLSAHSFGIAIDVGSKKAPYWRWSKQMPHPLQKTYPEQIVTIMENNGFIWGGKWHEYDLMHFEYRPEIICKSRMRSAREKAENR